MTKDDTSKQPDLMSDKDMHEGEMEDLQQTLSESDARQAKEEKKQ